MSKQDETLPLCRLNQIGAGLPRSYDPPNAVGAYIERIACKKLKPCEICYRWRPLRGLKWPLSVTLTD